jgi:putative ABC transport system permease protein
MATRLKRLWKRLQLCVWRRADDDRDLADEIRFHLAEEERLRIEAGVPSAEARASARRDFGNVLRVTEITRSARGWAALEAFVQDLRFSARLLRRNRVFALFCIASLALGIGATGAIFSLFDAIVLRELPVREPGRLISLSFAATGTNPNKFMTYPHFAAMRDTNQTLDGLFAWTGTPRVSLSVQGHEDIGACTRVSGDYYRTLGLRPALGRLLTADDDHPGSAAAVISHGYWQRRFAGSPAVIGAAISLNHVPFTIVGVEPRGFSGINVGVSSDVIIPLRAGERLEGRRRDWNNAFSTWIEIMGRVRPGLPIEQAAEDLKLIFARVNASVAQAAPEDAFAARVAREARLFVEPGAWGGVSRLRMLYERWLLVLLMMLAAVMLLACLNVATLLLARSEARKVEIATRLAIGAGRWRVVRQLMTESLVIAVISGVLGLALSWWASLYLLRIALASDGTLPLDLSPDARAIGFAILMSVVTSVLFGLLPALRATASLPRSAGRGLRGPRKRWLERGLVGTQSALSLVLVVFAALFVRTLQNLWTLDPGYDRTNVVMFSIDAGLAGKRGPERTRTYQSVLDAVGAMPGAMSVSASVVAPVSTSYYFGTLVTQAGATAFPDDRRLEIAYNLTAPGYFAALRIPLLAGRDFDARDRIGSPRVAIVSERLAARFAGNPIGQRLVTADGEYDVIGVARDTRYANIRDAPRDVAYFAMLQSTNIGYAPTVLVRHAGSASDALRSARAVVASVAEDLTLFQTTTLETRTRESLSRERLLALLSAYAGGFALLLACIGLYGLMMYGVTQRTPELGLRMALGSPPSAIRRIVLREGVATVLAGAVAGFAAAWLLVRLVRAQLYAVEPTDPVAFAASILLLVTVAGAAAYLPAWRASRIDPLTALRRE